MFGKKFGFGDCSLIEFCCRKCGLFEEKNNRDADYSAWAARWDGPASKRKTAPAKQAAKAKKVARAKPAEVQKPVVVAPPLPAPDPREGVGRDGRALAECFAEVVARPAEDGPRLAYAEAIAEAQPRRSALIRYQVLRYRADLPDEEGRWAPPSPELVALGSAVSVFEHRMQDGWGRYIEPFARSDRSDNPSGWALERGFVARLRADAAVVADPAIKIFERAPIEYLSLTAVGDVPAVLRMQELAQMRRLDLGGLGLRDEDVAVLAREGHLARCEELDLRRNEITEAGFATLVASAEIRAMRSVRLDHNPCDPHMQYSWDCHGTIADMWLPAAGEAAEAKYGRIAWLHPLDDA